MSSALRIRRLAAKPTRLRSGRAVIENYEWYQLTLGRFLAPAVCEAEGEVSYALLGCAGGRAAAGGEIAALGQALERLQLHCSDLVRAEAGVVERYVALEALLELRLPDAKDADAWHLVDGQLMCTDWGLADRGVRLAEVLDPAHGAALRQRFLLDLRATLGPSGAELTVRNDAPLPAVGSIFPVGEAPLRSAAGGGGATAAPPLARQSVLKRIVYGVARLVRGRAEEA
jgi:hypothetical protein